MSLKNFSFAKTPSAATGGLDGEGRTLKEDKLSEALMVGHTFGRGIGGLRPRPFPLEVRVLKHFMRYKPGWWVLHIAAVTLTLYLGHMAGFKFQ